MPDPTFASAPDIVLNLMGPGRLRVNGEDVLPPGKPLFLLAYLACQPNRTATRARIIDLLWADVEPSRARVTLRQTLHQLRARVASDLIAADGDDLTLRHTVSTDRDALLVSFAENRWREVVSLGAHPFLMDAAGPGCEVFERWASSERQRCRDLVESATASLLKEALNNNHPALAMEAALAWRSGDPEYEPAHRALVHTLAELGDFGRARLELQALCGELAARNQTPSTGTAELIAQLAPANSQEDLEPRALESVLVGRTELFAMLVSEQRRAAHQVARRVTLVGAPGVGKTRLMMSFRDRLASQRITTAVIRAVRAGRDVEYAVLAETVRGLGLLPGATAVSPASAAVLLSLAPDLARIYQGSRAVSGAPAQHRLVLALTDLLQAVAGEHQTAIFFDDMHWWDASSAAVIHAAMEQCAITPLPLFIVGASRQGNSAFPAHVTRAVEPLNLEDIDALMRSLAQSDDPAFEAVVRAVRAASGGIAQLALDAIRWLMDRNALAIRGDTWAVVDASAAQQLASGVGVVAERIALLSEANRSCLRWLAVAEERLRAALLPGECRPLEDAGFVTLFDGTMSLAHDIIGERVLATMTSDQIADACRQLASTILDSPTTTTGEVRPASQLAIRARDTRLACDAYLRWKRISQRGHRDIDAWARFAGAEPKAARSLLRAGLVWRERARRPMLVTGLAAMALVMVAFMRNRTPAATRLVIPGNPARVIHSHAGETLPALEVEGETNDGSPGYLEHAIALHASGSGVTLMPGQTIRRQGRMEFRGIRVAGDGTVRIWFVYPGMDSIAGPWVTVGENFIGRLDIVGGKISGQELRGTRPEITVSPGQLIDGEVVVHALTVWRTAAVIMGAVARWGDRRSQWCTLQALPPDGDSTYRVALKGRAGADHFTAPAKAGRYQLVILAAAETDFVDVASGTNWTAGPPAWFDGTDVADWPAVRIDSLARNGYARIPITFAQMSVKPSTALGAVIDVVVTSESGSRR